LTTVTQTTKPILVYAATPPAGSAVEWRDVAPGHVEVLIPPPPLWRLIAWPALKLVVMTPFVLFALAWALFATASGARFMAGLGVVGFIFGAGAWIGMLTDVIRIARDGRKPFAVEVGPDGVRLRDAGWDAGLIDLDAEMRSGRRVIEVAIEPVSPGLFYRSVRLYLKFAEGSAVSANIPIDSDTPADPVEEMIRRAVSGGDGTHAPPAT
jgi:hypothetical protein